MNKSIAGLILAICILTWLPDTEGQERLLHPGQLYKASIELYDKGRCEEASEGFSKIVQSAPASELVSYSQYMIGLCYLKAGRYEEAIEQLELYLEIYPEGDRVREAEKGIQDARQRLKEKPLESPAVSELRRKSLHEGRKVKRRICVQVSTFEGKSLEELEKRVKELKNDGVNTILFRVFQNKGDRLYKFVTPRHEEGVYFKTEYAPVVDDILGKVAEIVHRNGLEIFAWTTTRYANYGFEGSPEYQCWSYNFETEKMEVARGFNLFHPEVMKRLEGLFRDLGRNPIDGILFQDDLILKHNEDFSAEANKAFLKEFGYMPHPDLFYIHPYRSESGKYFVKGYTDRFMSWANWKNRWLMNVAKQLMEAARESNPNLQFAINLYFEAVMNDSKGMVWFSQTLSEALGKDFDYYAVMAYHRQAMKDLKMELKEAIDLMGEATQRAVEAVGDPSRVLMKVWVLDWKKHEVLPKQEMEELLTAILNRGEVSLAFVPYVDQSPIHSLKEKWASSK
jgi:tetratricopeptide (TPR) repeat protein